MGRDLYEKRGKVFSPYRQVDCRSIVSNLFRLNPRVSEKRLLLLVDLHCVKETILQEQAELFHVNGECQLADSLTKRTRLIAR